MAIDPKDAARPVCGGAPNPDVTAVMQASIDPAATRRIGCRVLIEALRSRAEQTPKDKADTMRAARGAGEIHLGPDEGRATRHDAYTGGIVQDVSACNA